MMRVRKSWTAVVMVAAVMSPPVDRPAVHGLFSYAMMNKLSKSPPCKRQQVLKIFFSTAGA